MRRTLVVAGAIGLVLAAPPALAFEWDQAVVTRLAAEFNEALRALLDDPGTNPEQHTAMQQRRHSVAIRNLQEVLRIGERLETSLRGGAGRDTTHALHRQLQTLLDEVGALADDSWVKPSAQERATAARRASLKLAEYYRNAE